MSRKNEPIGQDPYIFICESIKEGQWDVVESETPLLAIAEGVKIDSVRVRTVYPLKHFLQLTNPEAFKFLTY